MTFVSDQVRASCSVADTVLLYHSLEAATSRLEDIATSTELPKDSLSALNNKSAASPANGSAVSTTPQPPAAASKPAEEPLPEFVEEYDVFLNNAIDKYVKLSNELGGPVAQQVRKPHVAYTPASLFTC